MILTTTAVAKRLGITRHTVRWSIKKGYLKASKFGDTWMITGEDFTAFNIRRSRRARRLAQRRR